MISSIFTVNIWYWMTNYFIYKKYCLGFPRTPTLPPCVVGSWVWIRKLGNMEILWSGKERHEWTPHCAAVLLLSPISTFLEQYCLIKSQLTKRILPWYVLSPVSSMKLSKCLVSRVHKTALLRGHLDRWRWDHRVFSKRGAPITQWPSATF
jgi:hypothetical protein